ncbi:MAG: tetratricopeptide repeat protein [Isosphaeraceae bacterium]
MPASKAIPSRHQFEHQVPTQIHDPEQDMMILARWFHRALKNPTRFWGTVAGIAGAILLLVLLTNVVSVGNSSNAEVWTKLETAKSPSDRVMLAEDHPQSPAAPWARLQAATEFYNQGFADLPNNRDVALPTLKKALDNFDAVTKMSPPDSPQARAAAIGKARTLEARNELSKAIEQYDLVVKTWPGTAEAAEAKELAAALRRPDASDFYKQLYAYSPTKVTLPPSGSQNLDMPLLPPPPLGTNLPAEATPPGMPATIPLRPPPPPTPIGKADEKKAEEKSRPGTTETSNKPAASKDLTPSPKAALPELPFDGSPPATNPGAPAPSPKGEVPKPAPTDPAQKKS